jgi:ribosomal protein L40E|tara:strand:- start:1 stop:249 length:249 start_codon:yes stop_codon:yes gene_type:complete
MEDYTLTLIISVSSSVIFLVITFVIYYFVTKAAVRNGTIEAQDMLRDRQVGMKKETWVCPECKAVNPNDVYVCGNCEYYLGS